MVLGVGGWFWVLGLVLGLLFRCSVSGSFFGRWARCFLGSFLARVSGAAWRLVFAPLQGSVFCVLRSVKFCCRALFLMALPGGMALCYRVLFFTFCVRINSVAGLCFGPFRCSAGLLRPRVFLARFLGALGRSFFARFFRAGRGAPVAPGGVALGLRVGDGAGGARPWRCGDSPWRVPVRVPCRGAGLRVARSLCVFYGAWCGRGSAGGALFCVAALRKKTFFFRRRCVFFPFVFFSWRVRGCVFFSTCVSRCGAPCVAASLKVKCACAARVARVSLCDRACCGASVRFGFFDEVLFHRCFFEV